MRLSLRFKGSKVQGFKGSKVQGFKGSRVQGFKKVQRFLNDKIIALYARGLTVREIQAFLGERYATEVSASG